MEVKSIPNRFPNKYALKVIPILTVPVPQPINCTSGQDVATFSMYIPEEMSIWALKSQKTVVAGTEIQFSGNILYCWPYKWDNGIQRFQLLVHNAADEALKLVNTRVAGEWEVDPLPLMKDIAWLVIGTTPLSWRETAHEDEEAFRKLVLCTAYYFLLFSVDDPLERMTEDPFHAAAAKNAGRLLCKIFVYEFETVESLRQDSHFQALVTMDPRMQNYMHSFLDIAIEMKERFKVTASQSLGLGRGLRYLFELQTWLGQDYSSYCYNPGLRHALRCYNAGFNNITEFGMLLDGIVLTQRIRDDFYWNRQYEAARTLFYLINDIISSKKEIEEKLETGKPIDNPVLICMDVEKVKYEEALARVIEKHNKQLLEFTQDMKRMAADPDLLFDLDDEEKVVYFRSLEFFGITLSYFAQAHLLMGRYKLDGVKHTFEPYIANNSS